MSPPTPGKKGKYGGVLRGLRSRQKEQEARKKVNIFAFKLSQEKKGKKEKKKVLREKRKGERKKKEVYSAGIILGTSGQVSWSSYPSILYLIKAIRRSLKVLTTTTLPV